MHSTITYAEQLPHTQHSYNWKNRVFLSKNLEDLHFFFFFYLRNITNALVDEESTITFYK